MSEAKKRKVHTPEFKAKVGPKPIAAHREPELLYSEIGKLKVELDWLKKSQGSTGHDQRNLD